LFKFFDIVGLYFIGILNLIGDFTFFAIRVFYILFSTRLNKAQLLIQMRKIGFDSFFITLITSISSGFALALQTYIGLSKFGAQDILGIVVSVGITRELAPVLTGLMVTGRAGSAMAAELGTMQISEQIDALKTLCIDPYNYLIVPRVLAFSFVLPMLTIVSIVSGIFGGFIYSNNVLELSGEIYFTGISNNLKFLDIFGGLLKSFVFGILVSLVSSYIGYHTTGGAKGVGDSTTSAVVYSSIMILISNYFVSAFLFKVNL